MTFLRHPKDVLKTSVSAGMNYIVDWLHDGGKSVCLCRALFFKACCWMLFCKACSFTVFCQKKCHKKKKERKWHLDGLIPQVQVLSVFYPEVPCTTLYWFYITLEKRWISLAQTVFLENLILHLLLRGVQTTWDGSNFPK